MRLSYLYNGIPILTGIPILKIRRSLLWESPYWGEGIFILKRPLLTWHSRCMLISPIWHTKLVDTLFTVPRMPYVLVGRNFKLRYRLDCILVHPLTHWGRDKTAAIFQTTFSNEFSWMKMYEFRLRFHWSLFLRFELTISQHWFR